MPTSDDQTSVWRPLAEFGLWMGAESAQKHMRKVIRSGRIATGVNPRTMMGAGKLKSMSEFNAEVAAKEATMTTFGKLEGMAAKRAFRNKAMGMFGASRVEALLTRGLGIANLMFLAPMLYGMSYHGFKGIQRLGFELERPEMGGHMTLNSMAFTDRQRSIQAMHNSEFNGRSAIGQEAFLLHQ